MKNSEAGIANSELPASASHLPARSAQAGADRRMKNVEIDKRTISDEKLELLGRRFQANNICYLLDISFEHYLLAPAGWDRIARHLDEGGGCRMIDGQLQINQEARHA